MGKRSTAVGAVLAMAVAGPASAATQPARRPGLWVATVTSGVLGVGTKAETCVGTGTDTAEALFAQNRRMTGCTQPPTVTAAGGVYTLRMICSPGAQMTMDTTAVASGDFQSHYTVKTIAKMGSTMANMPAMAPLTVDVDVVWSGACPAELAPGDSRVNGKIYHPKP